jgi:hypothetical protein
MLQIKPVVFQGRRAWALSNDILTLTVLEGGGHFASLVLKAQPEVNPFWTPVWPTVEPWRYRAAQAARYGGSPLLASVAGHLLCLAHFGSPSAAEARAGQDTHGEAPVSRWRLVERSVKPAHARLRLACDLPLSGMRVERALTVRPGSHLIEVTTEVVSLTDRDQPFTMCEHGSFGPPFLVPGITALDLSADEGRTFPRVFGRRQRLVVDQPFVWPEAPASRGGTVDLRTLAGKGRPNSDFAALRMDVRRPDAWATLLNPRVGLLLAYQWCRAEFPWVGLWEENHCREGEPWNRRSLARGVEFANAPFPVPLQEQVGQGRLCGVPTYGWLPARGVFKSAYRLALMPVDRRARGVADLRARPSGLDVDLIV